MTTEQEALTWAETGSKDSQTDVKSFLLSKAEWAYDEFDYEIIKHIGDTEEELYDLTVSVYEKVKVKTEAWLKEMWIKNYTINDDLTVDVNGPVDLYEKELTSIPVQFCKVTGWFNCSRNQLTSLVGAPKKVGKSFHCFFNQLTSLAGAPHTVLGWFDCTRNLGAFTEEDVRTVCRVGGAIITDVTTLEEISHGPGQ
jgi:hypothetical protein